MSLPFYARPNSLVAWGSRDDRPDYDFVDGAVFAIYGLDDGAEASASIPDKKGREAIRLTVRRDGAALHLTASSADVAWALRLPKGLAATGGPGATISVDSGEIVTVRGRGSIAIGVSETG